jgi:hypothetical protein
MVSYIDLNKKNYFLIKNTFYYLIKKIKRAIEKV